jgi:hypothetical protein
VLLYAAHDAAPALALAPLCATEALTQLLSLAGGTMMAAACVDWERVSHRITKAHVGQDHPQRACEM